MRIDQARILEVVKAYEKNRLGSSRRQGQDRDRFPAIRDEVIISTEAKRQQILDRVINQVIDRLRNLPPSQHSLPEVDAMLEEVTRDIDSMPLEPREKVRIRQRSLDDLRRERSSR